MLSKFQVVYLQEADLLEGLGIDNIRMYLKEIDINTKN